MPLKFYKTDIEGAWVIEPKVIRDDRGYFLEVYNAEAYRPYIGDVQFVQDNESRSIHGVLRGMHYQHKHPQAKLVRVSVGTVIDIIVDLRKDSPTYLNQVVAELSGYNHRQVFAPRGCAHGFVVMDDIATFQYKVDNVYDPDAQVTLLYNDPDVHLQWPKIDFPLTLSEKDLAGLTLKQIIAKGLLPDA